MTSNDNSPRRWRSSMTIAAAFGTLFVALPYFAIFGLYPTAAAGMGIGIETDSAAVGVFGALIFPGMVATLLLAGGVGLALTRPWGWYAAGAAHLTVVLFNARHASPMFRINWEHPAADRVFLEQFLYFGAPILISLLLLVLLFLPSVRKACGVTEEKYVRPRRPLGTK